MHREFWQLFLKGYGKISLALLICVVTITLSFLEGLNMGLLVPLLEALQSPGQMSDHWVSRGFARLFGVLGLSMDLKTILLALGMLILLLAGLKYLRIILATKIREGFVLWMRSRAMWGLLHADISYFHHQKLGTLSDTLTTQTTVAGNVLNNYLEILTAGGVICAYLVAAFVISPMLAGVALAMLVVISLAMQRHVSGADALGERMARRSNELQAAAVETLAGVRVIKAFLLERARWLGFNNTATGVADASYRLDRARGQMTVLQETALFALIGALVLVGVSVLHLDMAVIVALLFVLYRLAPRVSYLNYIRQSLGANMAALYSVKRMMDQTANPKIVTGATPFVQLHRGIELENVGFSYDGTGEVLQGAHFSIEKGKVTAIVGASGAGKSTLIDLILRYHDPVKGSIRVDGVDLRELELASWRRAIGVVSQDIFLFNDTIAYNISLEQPGITGEMVAAAAKEAYAHDFIQRLPQGYETVVGDRGWNLSGGERQRIALARAILRKPEILILDEATSSLDSESERLIQRYLQEARGSCTIVLVAHRMATVQSADKIAVLQDGRIVEEGDWESLLARSGVFANFKRLQSLG